MFIITITISFPSFTLLMLHSIYFKEVHYVQLPEQLYSVWPGEKRDEEGMSLMYSSTPNLSSITFDTIQYDFADVYVLTSTCLYADTLGIQYFNSNILRFSYTNFAQPVTVYDY